MVGVAKVVVVWLLARIVPLGARTLQLAVGLGQVGEFSYVLGALALAAGFITKEMSAGLIGAVVLSIAASSILVRLAGSNKPSAAVVQ
jgi:predicted Kef-type K+ transport protein